MSTTSIDKSDEAICNVSCQAVSAGRIHFLDWYRAVAILIVFLIHCMRFFDFLPWHVKNQEQSLIATHIMIFVSGWIMPLFLMISGAGAFFALKSRSNGRFVKDRTLRLMVPYLVGLVLLLPPQKYYEALYYSSFDGTIAEFVRGYIPEVLSADIGFNPSWLGHVGYHLWFLAFLWIFSVVALPLFRQLNTPRTKTMVSRLAVIAAKPFALFALVVPIVVLNVALKAATPNYLNWSDFLVFFVFFLLGYLVYSEPRFVQALEKNRWPLLAVALVSSSFVHVTFMTGHLGEWMGNPSYSPEYLMLQVVSSVCTFAWTVFLLAVGPRLFQKPHAKLAHLNERVLPFYAIHQTVIIVLGFHVVQLEIHAGLKFILITAGSFFLIAVLLELLVTRTRSLRWMFGMPMRRGEPA